MNRLRCRSQVVLVVLFSLVIFGSRAEAQVLFEDHFDSSTLSNAWTSLDESQWIQDGWMYTQSQVWWPRDSLVTTHDEDHDWINYSVSLKAQFLTGTTENFTVVLRCDGFSRDSDGTTGQGYQVVFNRAGFDPDKGYRVQLWRTESGVTTVEADAPWDLSADPMDIYISVLSDRIRVWVDDQQVIDFTDPDPLPYGGVGLHTIWESASRFDDVVITTMKATVNLDVTKAVMTDLDETQGDSFRIFGTYSFNTNALDQAFNKDTDELRLTVGTSSNPLVIIVPAGNPGWAKNSRVLTWKPPKQSKPAYTIRLDTVKRTFQFSGSGFDFSSPLESPSAIEFSFGNDYGSAEINGRRTTVLRFP